MKEQLKNEGGFCHWSIDDLRNIDSLHDWSHLKDYGWTLDEFNNARKKQYIILNNGELYIDGLLPMSFSEWVDDDNFINEYPDLYSILTKNIL